jgi:cytoskeleton protein RodZ
MGQEEDTEGPKPVGPEAGPVAGPGLSLTAAREQAGLSLMQAADQLHLDVTAVKALEAGRFEVLGAAVHARGHLRRYAELLGLPVQEVEKSFLQLYPARSAPDLRHGAGLLRKSDAGARALRPRTAALGALALVIIGVVLWALRVPHTRDAPARPVASAPTVSTAAADAAAAPGAPGTPSLEGTLLPSGTLPAGTAGSAARFNGQAETLWDPSRSSAAQRSPVDGGGGLTDGAPAPAQGTHATGKVPPARTHGTRP